MIRARLIVAASLALGAGLLPVFIDPAQAAQAVGYAPGIGNPVNILPSVAAAGAPAASSPEALAVMMLQWSKNPAFWKAAGAVQAGTATASQAAEVAAEAHDFTVPAVKAAPLLKTVGAVASSFGSFQLGTSFGSTAARIVGFNDNQVCAEENGVLTAVAGFLDGVDCTQYNELQPSVRNNDAQTGFGMQPYCSTSGNCVTSFARTVAKVVGGGQQGQIYACFSVTGSPLASVVLNMQAIAGRSANPNVQILTAVSSGSFAQQVGCVVGQHAAAVYANGGSDVATMTAVQNSIIPRCVGPRSMTAVGDPAVCSGVGVVPMTGPNVNPTRSWRCVITATNGHVYTATSAPFKETDASFSDVQCPALSGGDVAAHQTIYEDGGPSPITVGDADTTPNYRTFGTTYPECATGSCQLLLTKAGSPASCFETPADCASWFTDPNKASDYSCTYGTHAVSLSECSLYRPTFDPAQVLQGQQYADPTTGSLPGGQTGPKSGTLAPGTPVDDPDTTRDCFPTGWSAFNPVNWVLQPVGCALQWAFVPSTAHVAAVEGQFQEEFDESPPGKVKAFVAGLQLPAAPTGCSGIDLDFSGFKTLTQQGGLGNLGSWDGHARFLSACAGDTLQPYAVWVNLILSAVLIFGGVRAVLALIGRTFGYTGPGGS